MPRTRTEEAERADGDRDFARILVHVFSCEDLLAEPKGALRVEGLPELMIGRADDPLQSGFIAPGTLRLFDAWMSTRHAKLEASGDATTLVDLGSRNGTFVNGEKISRCEVRDGDAIEVGRSMFLYREVSGEAATLTDPSIRIGPTKTHSPETALLMRQSAIIAPSTQPVLIIAETGSGKELFARAVHDASGREGRFVAIDCGAIPESLFESTIFGHVRGAFTGAEQRTGEIERAQRGTLFLDEVSNMSPANQAKLLRVLETQSFSPLGAGEKIDVDVRWVAASNRELAIDEQTFRSDLLHRLAGWVARLPPLRARREDLGVLIAHALLENGRQNASLTLAAARALLACAFPGNVRQLRAVIRSAALLAKGAVIDLVHLPDLQVAPPGQRINEPRAEEQFTGPPTAGELARALRSAKGNVVRAAKMLNTHPRQIYRWIDKLELELDDYRS